jgi:hypothetical protein
MRKTFYTAVWHILLCLPLPIALAIGCTPAHMPKPGVTNEMVMSPGMSITATTPEGTIAITAGKDFNRTYQWDGAARSIRLWPRWERWHGSLGAYYPGPGEHWRNNHGITRGVLEEGQQHFGTVSEALQWIELPYHKSCVYRDDGLMVWWARTLGRKQLNVEIWQIYINGTKPALLPGSQNDRIVLINSGAR